MRDIIWTSAFSRNNLSTDGDTPHWGVHATTLAIASCGGALFAYMQAPLAWMLGAMVATTVFTVAGRQTAIPPNLRLAMITILGVLLGAAFTPELTSQIPGWAVFVVLLVIFVVATNALSFLFFWKWGGLDTTTAYFASTPGGISEMAIVGEEYGGDVRIITLVHAVRILLVVSTIPFYFRMVLGYDVPSLPPTGASLLNIGGLEGFTLLSCAVLGFLIFRPLPLPATALLGPMVLSAMVHLMGISSSTPPNELIAMAQVVVGTAIGCRFSGMSWGFLQKAAFLSVTSGILMIVAAVIAAFLLAHLVSLDQQGILLSFVPGGLTEMSLIALSTGVDTAFVSTMHVLRIMMVIIFAPIMFGMVNKYLIRIQTK